MHSVKRSIFILLILLPLIFTPIFSHPAALLASVESASQTSSASQPQETICGFSPFGVEEEISKHKEHAARLSRQSGEVSAQAVAPVHLVGDLAVIEDNGTIVMPPNDFDLKKRSLLFTPDGDAYQVGASSIAFTKNFGQPLTRFTGADGRPTANANNGYTEIPLDVAPFTFFGETYTSVFVGINGYVTFREGDTTARTSAVALAREMPRLAPLWADLDVTREGGIYYNRLADRHLFTWAGAAQVHHSGLSTFQLALYDDGRIAFVYKKVKARNALIGISRGGIDAEAQPLDLSATAGARVDDAAFESFSRQKRIDVPALTQAFYAAQPDVFDTVYVWTDFAFDNGIGYATAFVVRNEIEGIGIRQFDRGAIYGSPARLSSVVMGGDIIGSWIANPNANRVALYSAIAIVAHEQGHRWLSYIQFAPKQGQRPDDLLGRDLNHWNFLLDSRSTRDGAFNSVMEGNAWSGADGASGTFRTIQSAANYFNELDQYLMGLRPASEVRDLSYIYVNDAVQDQVRFITPTPNFAIAGERKTVSINQIIAREGERLPSAETAQKEFRVAFILLTEGGAAPSTLERLERYRTALVEYFSRATERRGALDATLVSQ